MKKFRSKFLAILISTLFIFTSSPFLFAAEKIQTGNLVGFVYDKDGKTPLKNAVVLLKNLKTNEVYRSQPTGEAGEFRLTGLPDGFYVVGIEVDTNKYNATGAVRIVAGKTATLSFSLRPLAAQKDKEKKEEKKKKKRKGIIAFFKSPAGIAVIIAGTAAIVYGIYELTKEEKEEEVSPVIH